MTTPLAPPDSASPFDLEGRLRAVVPAVRVVRARHLRKVLDRLAEAGEPVPTNLALPLWIGRDRLREMDVVPEAVFDGPDDRLLLVTAPVDRFPRGRSGPDVLRHYWRLLFRASVSDELFKQVEAGRLTVEEADERFAALGPAVALEARFVLEADHVVPWGADPLAVYVAFVAAYAEAAKFDPHDLNWVFPSLPDAEAGLRALGDVVAFDRLFARTRPADAADPPAGPLVDEHAEAEPEDPDTEPVREAGSGWLLERSKRAAAMGNHVRAAILRARAGQSGWPVIREGLVPRLAKVLRWDEPTERAWAGALGALARPAARGVWPRAARALYDLQKIAVDLEGGLYVVDPVEWVLTLGRRPLRRRLTRARTVVLHRHLVTARRHLLRSHAPAADRDRLDALLVAELNRAEDRIRADLGPVVRGVLDEVGLRPANVAERVAQDKVVGELLDRVCERGFLRIGDLRDAVSRNQLKMPDLRGPAELLRGDPLLRADERLAVELDGVYHRGEAYLRWIQRGTAAAFGTRVGRWLSKYVAFPFGGAFLTVEFAKYVAHESGKLYSSVRALIPQEPDEDAIFADFLDEAPPPPPPHPHGGHGVSLTPESVGVMLALGCLFLGLLYWPAFRNAVWAGVKVIWSGVRFVLVTLPLAVWRSPPVRAARDNAATRFVRRHFGVALLAGLLAVAVLVWLGAGPARVARWAGGVFAAVAVLSNTPLGRRLGDETAAALSDAWRDVRVNLVPGLLSWIAWAFRELAGAVERGLYAVDEWFRFREGQPRRSLAAKVALAVVWFPVAYLVRFGFTLLLEPQINPLKHFPVVTVSHKLLLPLIGAVSDATGLPEGVAAGLIACIPGIFGFIAWELRANWRLYAANRPAGLPHVVLGHHGETMRGLLRPGFHSGTVPGLFRKLRAAVRKAEVSGRVVPVGRPAHGLAEVAHAVELFAERELVPLLRSAVSWRGLTPRVGPVRVGVQTIAVEVEVPELGGPNFRLAFDHRGGMIVARVGDPGWLDRLDPRQRQVFDAAVAGLCAMGCAGPPGASDGDAGRIVWPWWVEFWDSANRYPG